ncbi:MAG: hypothetical protein OXB92_17000 [Acidimicrobiaceae bacterium]|nr:hypothetical protein [Acidimicrobiaceae bacterium]
MVVTVSPVNSIGVGEQAMPVSTTTGHVPADGGSIKLLSAAATTK